jgi:hypothetical protein
METRRQWIALDIRYRQMYITLSIETYLPHNSKLLISVCHGLVAEMACPATLAPGHIHESDVLVNDFSYIVVAKIRLALHNYTNYKAWLLIFPTHTKTHELSVTATSTFDKPVRNFIGWIQTGGDDWVFAYICLLLDHIAEQDITLVILR